MKQRQKERTAEIQKYTSKQTKQHKNKNRTIQTSQRKRLKEIKTQNLTNNGK
jgi:hypothetical protein